MGRHRLDVLRGFDQRLDARRRVALVGVLDRDRDDRPGLEIDGMLGFVGQVGAMILHLRDLCVGIVRMRSVVVRPFLLPLPIDPRQVLAGRRLDTRSLRQLRQEVLIGLPGVAPGDAPQRGVGLEGRRVDADRRALDQPGVGQALQHSREDRAMRLQINQPTRARNRRVVRGRFLQPSSRKLRMLNESAARQAIARSESRLSK